MESSNIAKVACKLSGMPDLTLAFSNASIMDDVGFHPCVRYQRWEQGRVISFVPPDGAFQLMTYR
jgi:AP-3 complex subunit mu